MNPAPSFTQLLNNLSSDDDGSWSVNITENWMQGRTTYGGLSSALCLKAVLNTYPNLPPLRSAQINFTGPVGGLVTIKINILRQGKSVNFIQAELFGEKGLAVHAVFCFGIKRASKLNKHFTDPPQQRPVNECETFLSPELSPAFALNYESKIASGARPISGSTQHELFIWARHKDKKARDINALIGIADMTPPATLSMFTEPAPVSSMTWMVNFLSDNSSQSLETEQGWWLLRSSAEHAKDGYSSQDMQIWNSKGELIITGRQNVAVFY